MKKAYEQKKGELAGKARNHYGNDYSHPNLHKAPSSTLKRMGLERSKKLNTREKKELDSYRRK